MFVSKNTSPFLAEAFVSTDKRGQKSSVAVVRATFDVGVDGSATASDVQTPLVFADTHYGDPATTSVQCESDFVPIKPRAEILLNASAVAPYEKLVEQVEVGLFGSGLRKQAIITGERYWTKGFLRIKSTPPTPFHSLPLAWHLAFGGTDKSHENPRRHRCELRNPIGTGFHVNTSTETIVGLALPCVEHPQHRMRSWRDTPEPIGFGPVSRFAKSRVRFAGTYDQHWMDEVLPFLPADFDERYFQAAPEDQQLDGLEAGTEFMCLNMSVERKFVVRLPALNVAVNFLFDDKTYRKPIKPDTLIIEPHQKRIILVGRASVDLPRKFTRLREIVVEPHDRKPNSDKPRYKNLAEAVDAVTRFK
jgi:hypothetical protein